MPLKVEYEGDGVTTNWPFSFSYLQESFVKVYLDSELQTTGYSVGTSPSEIIFDTAPALGVTILIQRVTDVTELPTFNNGTINTAETLNTGNDIVENVIEEVRELSASAASDAQESADAAKVSEENAAISETNAGTSETDAASSALSAESSAASAQANADYLKSIADLTGLDVVLDGGGSLDTPVQRTIDGGGA